MNTSIDDMIDMISSGMPEFLNEAIPEDIDIFSQMSYLILMAKIIAVPQVLSIKSIDKFIDNYFKRVEELIDETENQTKAELAYDYICEFYLGMMMYLEQNEEYEMCSNFKRFFVGFNEKANRINGELEE